MTNLEMFENTERILTREQRVSFENYFLGAIAVLVDPRDWQEALKTALRLATRGAK